MLAFASGAFPGAVRWLATLNKLTKTSVWSEDRRQRTSTVLGWIRVKQGVRRFPVSPSEFVGQEAEHSEKSELRMDGLSKRQRKRIVKMANTGGDMNPGGPPRPTSGGGVYRLPPDQPRSSPPAFGMAGLAPPKGTTTTEVVVTRGGRANRNRQAAPARAGATVVYPLEKRKKKKKGSLFDIVKEMIMQVGPGLVSSLGSMLAAKHGGPALHPEAAKAFASRLGDSPSMGIAFGAANPEQWLRDVVTTKSEIVGESQLVTGADFLVALNNASQAYTQGDTIVEFPFNPRQFLNTSLALESRRFLHWNVPAPGDFVIVYMPASPTTTPGQLIGYWVADVDIDDVVGQAGLRRGFSTAGEAPCQIWQPQMWPWIGAVDKGMTSMFTDPGTSDPKWSTPGKFVLKAATDIASGDLQGTLHMMYKNLEFMIHQLNVTADGLTTSWAWSASTSNNEFVLTAPATEPTKNDEDGVQLNNSVARTLYFGIDPTVDSSVLLSGMISSSLPVGTVVHYAYHAISAAVASVPGFTLTDATAIPHATTYTRGSTAHMLTVPMLGTVPPSGAQHWIHVFSFIITGTLPRILYTGISTGLSGGEVTVTTVPQLQAGMDLADFYAVPVLTSPVPPTQMAGGESAWLPYRMRKQRQLELNALMRDLRSKYCDAKGVLKNQLRYDGAETADCPNAPLGTPTYPRLTSASPVEDDHLVSNTTVDVMFVSLRVREFRCWRRQFEMALQGKTFNRYLWEAGKRGKPCTQFSQDGSSASYGENCDDCGWSQSKHNEWNSDEKKKYLIAGLEKDAYLRCPTNGSDEMSEEEWVAWVAKRATTSV